MHNPSNIEAANPQLLLLLCLLLMGQFHLSPDHIHHNPIHSLHHHLHIKPFLLYCTFDYCVSEVPMNGKYSIRGYIIQTEITMLECLTRDDWDSITMEPDDGIPGEEKVDIKLYKDGKTISAIQVKSSINPFERHAARNWLEELKKGAGCDDVDLVLVGDHFTQSCKEFMEDNKDSIRPVSYTQLEEILKGRFHTFCLNNNLETLTVNDVEHVDNAIFRHLLANSTESNPYTRSRFEKEFKAVGLTEKTVNVLRKRLETIRNHHSSFKLMNNVDPLLYPHGVVTLGSELTGMYEGKEYRFHDFIHHLFTSQHGHVLFIKGDGGTGKTVSLLKGMDEIDENIPAIYIPMYELNDYCTGNGNCITEYLKNHDDYCDSYEGIKELAYAEWEGKPNLILLLDGFNEVYNSFTGRIRTAIREWARRPGVFIICTSRFMDQIIEDPIVFELNHLTPETAHDYLAKVFDDDKEKIPDLSDPVYDVLDTPLMLNLYAQTERYKTVYRDSFYRWHDPVTSADILWNYFQKELARCSQVQDNTIHEISFAECAMLIMWMAPYICYHMEQQYLFEIPGDDRDPEKPSLTRYIKEAYDSFLKLSDSQIPDQVRDLTVKKALTLVKPEDSGYKQKLSDYFYYLTSGMAIFCQKQNENTYTLMHQNFRDFLAAMHVRNAIAEGIPAKTIPQEFRTSISEYVKDYLAEEENKEELLPLWNLIRKENAEAGRTASRLPGSEITLVHNFLRVYGKVTGNDFTALNWSEMNLKDINLYSYRKENSYKLLFAENNPDAFQGTKISLDSFRPEGHTHVVSAVAYSPDGRLIASGSWDKTIRIWDAETHRQIGKPYTGHAEYIFALSFSKDGRRLTSLSCDGSLQTWEVETRKTVSSVMLDSVDLVNCVAISPDGQMLAGGASDHSIRLWDIKTLRQIGEPFIGHDKDIVSVAFSKDGRRLVSGSYDNTIRVWDIKTHKQIGEPLAYQEENVLSVALSPDGRRIVCGAFEQNIRIWDVDSHEQIGPLMNGNHGSVYAIAFSPDGRRIISGSTEDSIHIWDAVTHRQIGGALEAYRNHVDCVVYNENARKLACGLSDGSIRILDAVTYKQVGSPLEGRLTALKFIAFSPDGRRIAGTSADLETMDNTVRIWDVETHKQAGKQLRGHRSFVTGIAFSPDGKLLAGGSVDNTILIWDTATGQQVCSPLEGHTEPIFSVAFSPDGSRILSTSNDQTIRIWDVENHKEVEPPLTGAGDLVLCAAVSPDGRQIAGGIGGRRTEFPIHIWDMETHEKSDSMLKGHTGHVHSIAYNQDGSLMVSGSGDHTVRLWNPRTYKQVGRSMTGHTDAVSSVAFLQGGSRIVSGSADGTIRIWDTRRRTCIETIHPLFGIDLSGLDFSKAILSRKDRDVFRQNGVTVDRNFRG